MFLLTPLAGLVFLSTVQAFAVTKGSPCQDDCALGIYEGWGNFTCSDEEYSSTDNGKAMKACLQCESSSTAHTSSLDNDIYWYLFNMKYVAQTCLYDSTAATTALPTCEDACQPIRPVLKTLWLSKPQSAQYDYCSIHSGAFMSDSDECASCLRSISGSVILGNFLNAMKVNCETKPDASKGDTGIDPGGLFDTNVIAAPSSSASSDPTSTTQSQSSGTATSTTESAESSSSTPNANPSSTRSAPLPGAEAAGTGATTSISNPTQSPSADSTGSNLSSGAAAGIGAACGALGVALLAFLFFFLWRRRQRRQSQQKEKEKPLWPQGQGQTYDYTKPEMNNTSIPPHRQASVPPQRQEMQGSYAAARELGGNGLAELPGADRDRDRLR